VTLQSTATVREAAPIVREIRRVGELDGVRAIAIWLVLLIHLTVRGELARIGPTLDGFPRAAFLVLDHMWLGVDLFFVLSGFLITGILLDAKGSPTYFRSFYFRRIQRIVPLVVLVLAVLVVVAPRYWEWYALSAFFLSDFAPIFHVYGPPGAPPFWSLAVEEQFYLLWPILVLALSRRRLVLFAAAIVAVEPVLRYVQADSLLEVPWLRWDGLALGALVAVFVRSASFGRPAARRIVALGVAAIAALVVVEVAARNAALSGALRLSEADLLFALWILACVAWTGSRAGAPMRSRAMRFFADTSFCVYLIHVPLIVAADGLGIAAIRDPFAATFARAIVALPPTFALAALSYRYFEGPILRWRRAAAR
jgi:peptidoglycan/LPS O-acetylase OafA/YrhL